MSRSTGWRPSRSATSRLRRSEAVGGRRRAHSPGGARARRGRTRERARRGRARSPRSALGTAMTRVVAPCLLGDRGEVVPGAAHTDPREVQPRLAGVVVEQGDGHDAARGVAHQALHQHAAAGAGAEDDCALVAVALYCRWVRRERMRKRAANMPVTAIASDDNGTLRGRSTIRNSKVRPARVPPAMVAARATSLVSSNEPTRAPPRTGREPPRGHVHDDHDQRQRSRGCGVQLGDLEVEAQPGGDDEAGDPDRGIDQGPEQPGPQARRRCGKSRHPLRMRHGAGSSSHATGVHSSYNVRPRRTQRVAEAQAVRSVPPSGISSLPCRRWASGKTLTGELT